MFEKFRKSTEPSNSAKTLSNNNMDDTFHNDSVKLSSMIAEIYKEFPLNLPMTKKTPPNKSPPNKIPTHKSPHNIQKSPMSSAPIKKI